MNNEMHTCLFVKCINGGWPKLHERSSGIKFGHKWSEYRVHTLFWTKNSRSFQGHISRFSQGHRSVQKRALSLSFFILSQHEQFYPEGLPVFAPFRHMRMVRANPGNSQNSSLNLVCPRFKRETEGARTFSVWAAGLWKKIPISFKKIECVHSFKKPLIDFYASS